MPKKKATRTGFQTTIRLTDLEYEDFDRAARFEGFSSIASWMFDQAKWRADLINEAIVSGEWVEVRGKKIPLSDLPEDLRNRVPSVSKDSQSPRGSSKKTD